MSNVEISKSLMSSAIIIPQISSVKISKLIENSHVSVKFQQVNVECQYFNADSVECQNLPLHTPVSGIYALFTKLSQKIIATLEL